MMKIICILLLCVFLSSCAVTKIYIVRHAEKANNSANPELKNPEGFARANALKDSMQDIKLTNIYSTNFLRTVYTVESSASAHGRTVTIYKNADSLIDKLILQKNKRILVAGHSNTIPQMIRHINLDPGFAGGIPDNDFDNLFVITIRWKNGVHKSIVRKTYGAASP